MNKDKVYLTFFNLMILFPFIYLISFFILSSFDLTFTYHTLDISVKAQIILALLLIIWSYANATEDSSIQMQTISKAGLCLAVLNIIIMLPLLAFSTSLKDSENYTKINGKQMISIDTDSSTSYTNYYDSKTIFLRSKNIKFTK
ncbi:hypothetical protein [Inconstantimicrobium porci]|uniref:hypothetical protein n=1 Tax=Inconstantimicrobium porci TaxID=2652291 RepID=UPI0024099E23|nr:hypothetical protein [Inconstantimicrobium porci]MDD6771628.1 hypothetical protein [Inconstantimicrobium porci]